MKTAALTAAALAALTLPAFAQSTTMDSDMGAESPMPGADVAVMEQMDADADGFVTLAEVQAVFPDVQAEVFDEADVDADGLLNADEVVIAQADGLLPEEPVDDGSIKG
ncbi:hypothetical protein [Sagittula stellata]|uniref:EF-hand domain-containing protein n=1 Tax=Sagittula stellata (strain ATCC 700073 / DSM 11524 / E-37) TaxID=388399 RepID=A3K674_SAGS3|nr:hypothetical protein [Sagittula stellata]EBA07224.1 hypothetical protein SSE37_06294 [Sagittula stellata E-37]